MADVLNRVVNMVKSNIMSDEHSILNENSSLENEKMSIDNTSINENQETFDAEIKVEPTFEADSNVEDENDHSDELKIEPKTEPYEDSSTKKHNRRSQQALLLDQTMNETKAKKKTSDFTPPKLQGNGDIFCWRCHKNGHVLINCCSCPRVYHVKCAQVNNPPRQIWLCPECELISRSESAEAKSKPGYILNHHLNRLLSYTVNRMLMYEGSEHFATPVDTTKYEDYLEYVLEPMDISKLESNIRNSTYESTDAFIADVKWMVHNSYIYNSVHSELTLIARGLLKIAKQECEEIHNCMDCYEHAHTIKDEWFIEPCTKPHLLVWARLKGFPFWPGKVMKVSGLEADVRFFGDHNRSMVPITSCYLLSRDPPNQKKARKMCSIDEGLEEVRHHIQKLANKYGKFVYAPYRTQLEPRNEHQQRLLLLPNYDPESPGGRKVTDSYSARISLNQDNLKRKSTELSTSNTKVIIGQNRQIINQNKSIQNRLMLGQNGQMNRQNTQGLEKNVPLMGQNKSVFWPNRQVNGNNRQGNCLKTNDRTFSFVSTKKNIGESRNSITKQIQIHPRTKSSLHSLRQKLSLIHRNRFPIKRNVPNDNSVVSTLKRKILYGSVNRSIESTIDDDSLSTSGSSLGSYSPARSNDLYGASGSFDSNSSDHQNLGILCKVNYNSKSENKISQFNKTNTIHSNDNNLNDEETENEDDDSLIQDIKPFDSRSLKNSNSNEPIELDSSDNSIDSDSEMKQLDKKESYVLSQNFGIDKKCKSQLHNDDDVTFLENEEIKSQVEAFDSLPSKNVKLNLLDGDLLSFYKSKQRMQKYEYPDSSASDQNSDSEDESDNVPLNKQLIDSPRKTLYEKMQFFCNQNRSLLDKGEEVKPNKIQEPSSSSAEIPVKHTESQLSEKITEINITEGLLIPKTEEIEETSNPVIVLEDSEPENDSMADNNVDGSDSPPKYISVRKDLLQPPTSSQNEKKKYCKGPTSRVTLPKIVQPEIMSNIDENKITIHDVYAATKSGNSKKEMLDILSAELKKLEKFYESQLSLVTNSCATMVEEIDKDFEIEKQKIIKSTRMECRDETKMKLDDIKRKQWCVRCLREAKFHCCWSNSYCNEKCQITDWPVHSQVCTQYDMKATDSDLRLNPTYRAILCRSAEDKSTILIKDVAQQHEQSLQDTGKVYVPLKSKQQVPANKNVGTMGKQLQEGLVIKVPEMEKKQGLAGNKPYQVYVKTGNNLQLPVNIIKREITLNPAIAGKRSIGQTNTNCSFKQVGENKLNANQVFWLDPSSTFVNNSEEEANLSNPLNSKRTITVLKSPPPLATNSKTNFVKVLGLGPNVTYKNVSELTTIPTTAGIRTVPTSALSSAHLYKVTQQNGPPPTSYQVNIVSTASPNFTSCNSNSKPNTSNFSTKPNTNNFNSKSNISNFIVKKHASNIENESSISSSSLNTNLIKTLNDSDIAKIMNKNHLLDER